VRKDLEGSIATLRTEKAGLAGKLESLEKQLHSQDDTVSKSMANLNLQAATLAASKVDLAEEASKSAALEKELAATRDQLDELRTGAAADKKKRQLEVDSLEAEKVSIEKELKASQETASQNKEEIKELGQRLREAEETLTKRVVELEDEKLKLQTSHSVSKDTLAVETESELVDLKVELAKVSSTKVSLEQQILDLQARLDAKEEAQTKQQEKFKELEKTLTDMQSDTQRAQTAQISAKSTGDSQVLVLNSKIKNLQATLDEKQMQLATTKTRMADIQAEADAKTVKLATEVEALTKKCEELKRTAAASAPAPAEATLESPSESTGTYMTDKERRLAANNKLLSDLLSQTKKDKNALQAQLDEMNERVTSLQTDVEASKKQADSMKAFAHESIMMKVSPVVAASEAGAKANIYGSVRKKGKKGLEMFNQGEGLVLRANMEGEDWLSGRKIGALSNPFLAKKAHKDEEAAEEGEETPVEEPKVPKFVQALKPLPAPTSPAPASAPSPVPVPATAPTATAAAPVPASVPTAPVVAAAASFEALKDPKEHRLQSPSGSTRKLTPTITPPVTKDAVAPLGEPTTPTTPSGTVLRSRVSFSGQLAKHTAAAIQDAPSPPPAKDTPAEPAAGDSPAAMSVKTSPFKMMDSQKKDPKKEEPKKEEPKKEEVKKEEIKKEEPKKEEPKKQEIKKEEPRKEEIKKEEPKKEEPKKDDEEPLQRKASFLKNLPEGDPRRSGSKPEEMSELQKRFMSMKKSEVTQPPLHSLSTLPLSHSLPPSLL